jgi:RNA polymerase sigma factor (sigma-70 family)
MNDTQFNDTQLLERYVAGRDEAAFRALVVRHGPTVLKACRRILHDPHHVEDAFQAVFLVLVRKAPTIRDPEALGNWLYGVAYRIASRARRDALRRRKRERQGAEMNAASFALDRPWDDLGRVLREELDGLPTYYRAPLELCYLRGLGHEEAARELGWPLGTLKIRLVRGRRRLRERLDRRGLASEFAFLLLLLPRQSPAVPEELVEKTVQALLPETAAGPREGVRERGRASELARKYLEPRGIRYWGWPLGLVLIASLLLAGGLVAYGRSRAADAAQFADLPAGLMDVLSVDCR